jgi:3-hydroxybutyryl-CoA dehydratase
MSSELALLDWSDLRSGARASFDFVVTDEEMGDFLRISGDSSLAHTDDNWARAHGFDGAIVYGGLLLARLSRLVGTMLPGGWGVSLSWQIHYHRPLYVGQVAHFEGEIASLSEGTRTVTVKFKVSHAGTRLASGSAMSRILGPAPAEPTP